MIGKESYSQDKKRKGMQLNRMLDIIFRPILIMLYLVLFLMGFILSWTPVGSWFIKRANSLILE